MREAEDPRKIGLKSGLHQLTLAQLKRIIDYPGEMLLDEFNYHDGLFCPLAIGLNLDETMIDPSHNKVYEKLNSLGYKVNNTRSIEGTFYTTNRKEDLLIVVKEVMAEKLDELDD